MDGLIIRRATPRAPLTASGDAAVRGDGGGQCDAGRDEFAIAVDGRRFMADRQGGQLRAVYLP
jgi:hypothetical protein